MRRVISAAVAALCLVACSSRASRGGIDASGLATVFDSTADTVFARVAGDVPASALRHAVEELRIAPGAEDTSLFTSVSEFDVDAAGRFWVYDDPSNSILLFAPDGHLIRRIGRQGSGPGEFNGDNGMVALPDTGLAIWDARNARISFFTASGDYRTSWRTPAGFFTSNGLLTDRTGALYLRRPVTAPREGEILGRMGLVRLHEDGTLSDSAAPPDLRVPRDSYEAVSPDGKGRSSMGSQFAPSYLWAWQPAGQFVVADGGTYQISVARKGAKPLVIRREYPPVALSAEERSEEEARILYAMRQTDPKWSWRGPPVPSARAPLRLVFASRDGRIWAQAATPGERIPDDEIVPPRDKNRPAAHFRSVGVWEVFEADGRFLGRVSLPPRSSLMQADGDQVWVIGRNADDLPALMRLRIEPGLASAGQ